MDRVFTAMSSVSTKGTFWVPNGELLAFYRMDQSMVTDYPQVDIPEIGFNHPKHRVALLLLHQTSIR